MGLSGLVPVLMLIVGVLLVLLFRRRGWLWINMACGNHADRSPVRTGAKR